MLQKLTKGSAGVCGIACPRLKHGVLGSRHRLVGLSSDEHQRHTRLPSSLSFPTYPVAAWRKRAKWIMR